MFGLSLLIHSAFALSKGLNPLNTSFDPDSSWIWKALTTPRIKYFLWLCFHHSLPTCEVLSIRGINVSPSCSLFNSPVESIIYILRDCPVEKAFWLNLGVMGSSACFFSSPLITWLEMNCSSSLFSRKFWLP